MSDAKKTFHPLSKAGSDADGVLHFSIPKLAELLSAQNPKSLLELWFENDKNILFDLFVEPIDKLEDYFKIKKESEKGSRNERGSEKGPALTAADEFWPFVCSYLPSFLELSESSDVRYMLSLLALPKDELESRIFLVQDALTDFLDEEVERFDECKGLVRVDQCLGQLSMFLMVLNKDLNSETIVAKGKKSVDASCARVMLNLNSLEIFSQTELKSFWQVLENKDQQELESLLAALEGLNASQLEPAKVNKHKTLLDNFFRAVELSEQSLLLLELNALFDLSPQEKTMIREFVSSPGFASKVNSDSGQLKENYSKLIEEVEEASKGLYEGIGADTKSKNEGSKGKEEENLARKTDSVVKARKKVVGRITYALTAAGSKAAESLLNEKEKIKFSPTKLSDRLGGLKENLEKDEEELKKLYAFQLAATRLGMVRLKAEIDNSSSPIHELRSGLFLSIYNKIRELLGIKVKTKASTEVTRVLEKSHQSLFDHSREAVALTVSDKVEAEQEDGDGKGRVAAPA